MVDFRFSLETLFPQRIVRISSSLLPSSFNGNKCSATGTAQKFAEILDVLGVLSARAQNLRYPITSGRKLQMAEDQHVYLLADVNNCNHVSVIGFLKFGPKDLMLFDEKRRMYKVNKVNCVLDFYVHESKQRHGYGKMLYDKMLAEQNWQPQHLSVDRPSAGMMSFLRKNYKLENMVPQNYNFVVFSGFFQQPNIVESEYIRNDFKKKYVL